MKQDNYLIAITGKSASGKDTIGRILANQHGYKYVVSTTSRPMRSNETNHEDYHFVTVGEFTKLMNDDQLIEYRYYDTIQNGKNTRWHYGIERSEIDLSKQNYVCVVDLVGLEDLRREFGSRVISIYIDVPEEKRKLRAVGRDVNFEEAEFVRRCKDDNIKFEDVESKVDVLVENQDLDECVSRILYNIDYNKKMRIFFTQYCSY